MQIRTLFPVCTFALAAVAASMGGWLLTQAVIDDSLVERLERAVELDALWFRVADKVAIERPAAGNLLLDDHPAEAAALASLAAVREDTDRAYAALERRIVASDGAGRQLDIVRSTHQGLLDLRERARSNFTLARSERDPDAFPDYVAAVTMLLARLDAALDLGDIRASRQDGETMDLIALSRQTWLVRGFEAERAIALIGALDRGLPLLESQIEQQANLKGQIVAGRAMIEALVRRLTDHPEVTGMVPSVRDTLTQFDDWSETVISASREGRLPAVSALEFGERVVRIGTVLVDFRDAALLAARARVADHRQAARMRVALSGTAVLLIMIATIWTIRLLKRRIVSPMLALTETIVRLARRGYDVEVPGQAQADEIGGMAVALETLRQGAIVAAKNEAQIAHMARHDALTGLANRTLLQERLEQAIALAGRGETSAVLCLDLDRFKAVNDTFGHPVGDLLLSAVADRLSACAREIDTVSRLGGDEFVVLMVGMDHPEYASILAQRIVTTLNLPFELDGQMVSVGVSVGIAIAPQDGTSAVALLKNADTALYRAKLEEKGSFRYFKPQMNAELMARVELERDLRQAISTEAFELHYQPQFTLADPKLCGFEALLRWRHPLRGLISAGEIIPVAEDTGLIVAIGAWALRQACRDAVSWPGHLRVAVNLSAIQFKSRGLIDTVRQALDESRLPAVRLHLEITETALLANSNATLQMLQQMREFGAKIAMDDFGTGYSSLSYLRKFPFDCIKIDQSFVRDLTERADARAIIRAVVALGKDLGPRILAEGVETPEQLALLRATGCDEVQGYLLGRPMPAAQALRLAAEANKSIVRVIANLPAPKVLPAGQLSIV